MDIIAVMRMLGALGVVLGLLAGALWVVKRFDVRLPGRIGRGAAPRRLEIVERLTIDPKRSLVLLRRDGEEHLVLMSPEGHVALDCNSLADPADPSVPPYAALMAQAIERMWSRLSDEAALPAPRQVIAHNA